MGAHDIIGVFCDAQTVTDGAASENTIDMAVVNPQFGPGHPIFLCIRTNTDPTEPADTISIEVQHDIDNGSGAPNGTWGTVFAPLSGASGGEVTVTDARLVTAGAWIYRAPLPYEVNKRHVRLIFRRGTITGNVIIDAYFEDVPASDRVQVAVSPVGNP